MKSFNNRLVILVAVGVGHWAFLCIAGNQELVEQKTAEMCSINEQVAKLSAPSELKEGETVEIKASVRVERSPGKGPVVRDLKVESIKVSDVDGAASAGIAVPVAGPGKVLEPDLMEKKPGPCTSGFRQECLNVPAVN